MPLSERSKARVQLEASFFTFMAADAAVVGTALPLGAYFFGEPIGVDPLQIAIASAACFAVALLLLLIGAFWLTRLEDK